MNSNLLPKAIDNFRDHLIDGFVSLQSAYNAYKVEAEYRANDFPVSFEDFFHDWAQANWELLVERLICGPAESLVIYGAGSDYEAGAHSRVFFHDLTPTHEVACIGIGETIDVLRSEAFDITVFGFEGFVSLSDGQYDFSPPFDHILLSERQAVGRNYMQVVVPLNQVGWQVNEI